MRFLVDECTGPKVAAWLRGEGHEVFSVFSVSTNSKELEASKQLIQFLTSPTAISVIKTQGMEPAR